MLDSLPPKVDALCASCTPAPLASPWPRRNNPPIHISAEEAPPLVPDAPASVLDAALAYARRGWFVFPAPPGKKKSYKKEKYSGTKWGMTKDLDQIRADFKKWLKANVCLPTGDVNGFWVCELDTPKGHNVDGIAEMKRLEAIHGPLPKTRMAISPSGSLHYYFKISKDADGNPIKIRNSAGDIAPGIDVRGSGGMVVAPPSVKPGDGAYRWLNDCEMVEAPQWLLDAAINAVKKRTNGAAGKHATAEEVNWAKLRRAMELLSNKNRGWEDWNRVGMGLHHGTGGSDEALDLFDTWSQKSDKYSASGTIEKWSAYSTTPITDIGLGSIYQMVDEECPGWQTGTQRSDFLSYLLESQYIFVPTGSFCPGSKVNALLRPIGLVDSAGNPIMKGRKQIKIQATAWLDKHQMVQSLTWAPGKPRILENTLVSDGGFIDNYGSRAFNQYKPTNLKPGDATKAGPWLAHVQLICGDETEHVIMWLAHRVQRPGEKINHAILMGGAPGIGKDTLFEPVKRAVGAWNWQEIDPTIIMGEFTGYRKAVVLRINENRDMGDVNRIQYYNHTKDLKASPPDVLRVNEKHVKPYYVSNCVGVIETTNYKTDGVYLPPDDRRHLVIWCPRTKEDFDDIVAYFNTLWHFYNHEDGCSHVMAYLLQVDLSKFNAKADPPKTPAFWTIANANRSVEEGELMDVIESMGSPNALTIYEIINAAQAQSAFPALVEWLNDRRNSRLMRARLDRCGYADFSNLESKDGMWQIAGRRVNVYVKNTLSLEKQRDAVAAFKRERERAAGG
jgi:hypothetical protein